MKWRHARWDATSTRMLAAGAGAVGGAVASIALGAGQILRIEGERSGGPPKPWPSSYPAPPGPTITITWVPAEPLLVVACIVAGAVAAWWIATRLMTRPERSVRAP